MEFDVPIIGKVNQQRALNYAQHNLGNLGPVLAILCLVLFLLTMTLTWLYLFCCSLCCRKKKSSSNTTARGRPLSTSRPLSGRSDAPLRSPRVLEDDPTDPNFTGVSAYDHMDATEKQQKEAAAKEAGRKVYSFKRFYTCSAIFCGLSTICAAGVYLYQSKFDVALKNLVIDVEDLTYNAADFLCTSERSNRCTGHGLGQFVQKTEHKTTKMLGSITTFLGTIDDILPSINTTINTLQNADTQLKKIKTYASMINTNVSEVNTYKTFLLNPNLAGVSLSSSFPSTALPNISTSQLAYVNTGIESVAEAQTSAKAVYATVNAVVTGQVADTISSFDATSGSVATSILDPLDSILSSLLDVRNKTLSYYHLVHDNADFYGQYLEKKTLGLTLLFFIPVIFQILFLLCNVCKAKRCKGCSFHLILNMCVAYFCVALFLIFTLVFSLVATLSSTVCQYHLVALQEAPTYNLSLSSTKVVFGPETIESILNCPSGANATSDNNFISILGVDGLFNVTKEVGSATSSIKSAKSSFDPNTQIGTALTQLNSMSNSTSFNVSETAPIATYKNQLASLQASLPDKEPNLDIEDERTKFTTNYLSSMSWTTYQNKITDINTILHAVTNTIPLGFYGNYTFDKMFNLTYDTVTAHQAAWTTALVSSGYSFTQFRTAVSAADTFTTVVNTAVSSNAVVQTNLTKVASYIDNIGEVVDMITNTQETLSTVKSSVNQSLYTILSQANAVLAGLDTQVSKVQKLPEFVATAPEYAKCGFVGDFYEDGFIGGFCGDFKTSVATVWPFMLAAAFSLYVSFMIFSCHVRKPVWYLYPEDDLLVQVQAGGFQLSSPRSARPAAIVA